MENEALIYWEENIDEAVVTKEIFLERVERGVSLEEALNNFIILDTPNETPAPVVEVEDEVEDEDYFSEIVWEVEEDWEDLSIFGESVKAPLWA